MKARHSIHCSGPNPLPVKMRTSDGRSKTRSARSFLLNPSFNLNNRRVSIDRCKNMSPAHFVFLGSSLIISVRKAHNDCFKKRRVARFISLNLAPVRRKHIDRALTTITERRRDLKLRLGCSCKNGGEQLRDLELETQNQQRRNQMPNAVAENSVQFLSFNDQRLNPIFKRL